MSLQSESAGSLLRRERERQGLTVQKVAEHLRLDKAVIQALEDDSYEHSVPAVYAKGHLLKYSRFLGLGLGEGHAAQPPRGNVEASAPPMRQYMRPMWIAPHVKILPWAQISIAAAIIVVLLLFWWSPWKHHVAVQAATARVVPPSAVDDNPIASAAAGYAADMGMEPAAPAAAVATAVDSPTDVKSAGNVNMRLTFLATSWIDVRDASGRRLFVGHVNAGTSRTLAGRGPLRVNLGVANGVRVEINDHEVPISDALIDGKIARFLVGADGMLRPLAGSPRKRD
jgi:cytoskeleton protein RodZ